mgnify:FL=1
MSYLTLFSNFQKGGGKGAMKGTPLPFGHALGDTMDSDESDLSDGSMTEVTADVITPFSEHDMEPDSFDSQHGGSQRQPGELSSHIYLLMSCQSFRAMQAITQAACCPIAEACVQHTLYLGAVTFSW